MNNPKTLFNIFLITFFRISDLISTHYASLGQDHLDNELNLLVRLFHLKNKDFFYVIELLGILLLSCIFLFFFKNNVFLKINVIKFKFYVSSHW